MVLRAKKPEVKQKRLKMFAYGKAGVGKTTACIQFPNAYIFDAEKGTENYAETILESNSVVHSTADFDTIVSEIKELATTKHPYKTIIIDPVTQVYGSVKEKWTNRFLKYAKDEKTRDLQDWGPGYWGKIKSEWKAFWRLLLMVDMNVVITAHEKPEYAEGGQMVKIGTTFDSDRSDEYPFDYLFQIVKKGKEKNSPRIALNKKERTPLGTIGFPDEFEWSYENFCKYYGKEIIEMEVKPIELASEEQVLKLNKLIEIIKVDGDIIEKWLGKAGVSTFPEMQSVDILKCINYLEEKMQVITG